MVGDPRFRPAWKEAVDSDRDVHISAVSLVEVAWLERRGRLLLGTDVRSWPDKATRGSMVGVLPITAECAVVAASLPDHHRDPGDRFIVASSIVHRASLLSADGKIGLFA
jgi:PIN domain nuclease of toxin-antitoxin system